MQFVYLKCRKEWNYSLTGYLYGIVFWSAPVVRRFLGINNAISQPRLTFSVFYVKSHFYTLPHKQFFQNTCRPRAYQTARRPRAVGSSAPARRSTASRFPPSFRVLRPGVRHRSQFYKSRTWSGPDPHSRGLRVAVTVVNYRGAGNKPVIYATYGPANGGRF